jgi:ABC-type uncharacterized transport system substrate-binding protein
LKKQVKKTVDWIEHYPGVYHPKESRFEWPEFVKELEKAGLRVVEYRKFLGEGFMSFLCRKPDLINNL